MRIYQWDTIRAVTLDAAIMSYCVSWSNIILLRAIKLDWVSRMIRDLCYWFLLFYCFFFLQISLIVHDDPSTV